ncbi:SET domain-containing protein SmydA-8 [Diachasma alloeum]|uniref:SET domain-containing protein SmydA-8 n=1 Tax=Diachasma alloeum TaxID=454923 RepID=UPI0007381A1E|nr:SET domain-containing protein SmydA-8 [Diachasma alloeum]
MDDPERMEHLIRRHLSSHGLPASEDQPWCVRSSKLNGRGLFAARDIKQGEEIVLDAPVILGPRCYDKHPPMCVNCHKTGVTLFPCDRGCGLPVCSDTCENAREHVERECETLKKWRPNCGSMFSKELLMSVLPVRSLALGDEDKELIVAMKGHKGPLHGREIDLLKGNLDGGIDPMEEEFMLKVCRVMDTNAMETGTLADDSRAISLRALYPIGAMQNHSCTPNTRHYFKANDVMSLCATVKIKEGEELTMTYISPLWDTFIRRRYLMMSKHFECRCRRCSDPSEYGSNVGAMRCANMDCYGLMLPDDPLSWTTPWTCEKCDQKVSSRQIKAIISGIDSIINTYLYESPRDILKFVRGELKVLVPEMNSSMLQMKYRIVSYFGRTEGLHFKDLTDEELQIKSKYCQDLLDMIEKLQLGDCQLKGFILYELYCTKNEEFSRRNYEISSLKSTEFTREALKILDKAVEILQDDVASPDDLKSLKPPHTSTRTHP